MREITDIIDDLDAPDNCQFCGITLAEGDDIWCSDECERLYEQDFEAFQIAAAIYPE